MSDHKHILTLDLLRGFFLAVILVDHLYRFPNLWVIFTGEGKLWVSAAEGFFIISGLLVGYIYGPKILNNLWGTFIKLWRRAGKLYLCSISLTLLFTLWGQFLPADNIKSGIWVGSGWLNLIYKTIALKYVYGWADFLTYYAVFMLLAPLALVVARRLHGGAVLAASLVIWYLGRNLNGYFAWQLLFMSGLVVGTSLPAMEAKLRKWARPLGLVTVATLAASVYFVFVGGQNKLMAYLFDKNTIGPGRFMLAWLWFTTGYLFIRSQEKTIDKLTAGFFRILGQNSLYGYSMEAVMLFPINYAVPFQFGFIGNTLMTLTGGGVIYLLTVKQKQIEQLAKNVAGKIIRPEGRLTYAYQAARIFLVAILTRT
jgi:hypothetical protein